MPIRNLEPIETGNIVITGSRLIKEIADLGWIKIGAYWNDAINYRFTYTGGRYATFINCRIYEFDPLWSDKWEDVTGRGTPIYSLTDRTVNFEYRRNAFRGVGDNNRCPMMRRNNDWNVSDCNNINPIKIAFQLILNKDNQTYFKTFKIEYGASYSILGPVVPVDIPLSEHHGLTDAKKALAKKSP
jgi:hypothetical protein